MSKMQKVKRKPAKSKAYKSQAGGKATQIRVATIWKNQTKAGKPWYSLVLDTGERLSSFDPGVIFLAGGDPKRKVNNFDPPAILEGKIVDRGGYKHFELLNDDRPQQDLSKVAVPPPKADESDAISRMSILRTATMLMEYEKNRSPKRFQEIVKMCENYVFHGKLQ